MESTVRTDLLPEELTTARTSVKVEVETQFNEIVSQFPDRAGSLYESKNINEVMELILASVRDYEGRENTIKDKEVKFLYKEPDLPAELEAISICLENRKPGVFGQTTPSSARNSNKPRNQRPILRELRDDPDAPGYKLAVLGFFYDNVVSLTCWARTAKTANVRTLWVEQVMEEYAYYFKLAGVHDIYFIERGKDITKDIENNKIYGRSLYFYIRTEMIQALRQKTLEQIYVKLALTSS